MQVKEYEDLSRHSTFALGGQGRFFAILEKNEDIEEVIALSEESKLPLFILGKGSNCLFGDGVIETYFVEMCLRGKEIVGANGNTFFVRFGAGELFDDVIAWSIEEGLSGLEALSAIPGTVGATPVQNVGAYGAEIKDVLVEVEAYDLFQKKRVVIPAEKCGFAYRSSIFNTTERGRYIITSVLLQLQKQEDVKIPEYGAVQKYFAERDNERTHITALEVRKAITDIRWAKLPNPDQVPNLGSFFKNPIVEKEIVEQLILRFAPEHLPQFPANSNGTIDDRYVKLSAGFLIEKAGLKGKQFGNFSVYDKNSLVLVHTGKGSLRELLEVRDYIIETVWKEFSIKLEQEPLLIK